MSNKPETYEVQDGCYNCKFCLTVYDFEHEGFACMLKAPPLPGEVNHNPRVLPGATIHIADMETRRKRWTKWLAGRHVAKHGICDEHSKGE